MTGSPWAALTCFQEHIGEIKGPEPQEAIFRAGATERWGHAEAVDGDARIWREQLQARPSLHCVFVFQWKPRSCSLNKHHTTCTPCHASECTCLRGWFLPAVWTWLLCRLQPPDVFDYNFTVVNFEDITISAAGISVGKQPRVKNKDWH